MEEPNFDKGNYIETGQPSAAGECRPGAIVSATVEDNRALFICDSLCALEVTCITPETVRFRFATNGRFSDGFSYATIPAETSAKKLKLHDNKDTLTLETGGLWIHVGREHLMLTIEDLDGHVLSQDEKGFHWEDNEEFGGQFLYNSRKIQAREHFYGLGDIPGQPNLRGQRRSLWGSDVYGYGALTDPLYKNIPFFIGLHHNQAYGFFFDNSFNTDFDFGKERPTVASFWSQGGEMDFTFFKGPTVPDVVSRFSDLTGKPEMPPLWALAFHQCKWSYKSETEVLAIADGFRDHEIPCDAIYLDIDYMDGFRCFTWNKEEDAYPNPARLTAKLSERGIKTVAIIDPGIRIDPDYEIYKSGVDQDVFCRRMDGDYFKGSVWPGPCHFPDFTNPKARDWWADLFKPIIQDDGLAGIWTDMNEPAVFNEAKTFPLDVRHDYDGHPCSHRKAHNVYAMQMARATKEGLERAAPEKRPFVITRSAYAGTQRYSSAWTGDIQSTWEHLKIGNIQCQRLSLSGYSFVGTDIGGFSGKSDGELFIRWLQMGVFHPFCRVHSSGDENEQEPWSFGNPYTAVAKKFIELRYRILPYIYTLFEEHTRSGAPMLRSLPYLNDQDPEGFHRAEEFGLGDALFTCPINKPGVEGRWLYLPEGLWYDFWTNAPIHGGDEVWVDAPLESTPLFAKGGTVLPLSPVRMTSSTPLTHMELHVYTNENAATGSLYEDEGDGFGASVTKQFALTTKGETSTLTQKRKGAFKPGYPCYQVTCHGLPFQPTSVSIDGGAKVAINDGATIELPEGFKKAVFA